MLAHLQALEQRPDDRDNHSSRREFASNIPGAEAVDMTSDTPPGPPSSGCGKRWKASCNKQWLESSSGTSACIRRSLLHDPVLLHGAMQMLGSWVTSFEVK